MHPLIQTALRLAVAAAALAGGLHGAHAQEPYPSRPVTWLVPFAVGGPTDAIARTVAQRVSAELPQPVIVDNPAGAGGTVGAVRAARSKADGYTLFVGHIGTMAAAPYLFKSLKYEPLRDFVPIFRFPDTPMVLLVKNGARFKSARDLFEEARKRPGQLTFGTAGVGSSSHLAAEHLAATAGVKFTFVPYKGTGPAMTDLVGGQIDAMLDQTNVSLPQIQGGRLTALALTSRAPLPQFPGVPTLAGGDLPGFLASTWYGLYAPAGVPADTQATLARAVQAAAPALAQPLARNGLVARASTPQELAQVQKSEADFWSQLVASSGFKPED